MKNLFYAIWPHIIWTLPVATAMILLSIEFNFKKIKKLIGSLNLSYLFGLVLAILAFLSVFAFVYLASLEIVKSLFLE